ncbi:MAG: hypothetical protein VW405_11415 [Rhodospirillaceae bacterium]|jgi:hypothetical protein
MNQLRNAAARVAAFFDLQDAFVFGGIAAVTIGAGQIYPPLAWIIPGAACIAIGVKMGGR